MCRPPDSYTCFFFFPFVLFGDVAFSEFCTVAVFSLYREYVVRFPLPGGVFLPCDHWLDFLHQLMRESTNQDNISTNQDKTVIDPQNVWRGKLYHTVDPRSKYVHGKLVLNVLEPTAGTCNIGFVQHLMGEEQSILTCATGSGGRSARSTTVYTIHLTWYLSLLAQRTAVASRVDAARMTRISSQLVAKLVARSRTPF